MADAAFDYALWTARYPEFSSVSPALAGAYFAEAGLYLNNSAASVVTSLPTRLMFLNMITAHIAKLNATINGAAPSGLVGRINQATQGSVSVGAELNAPDAAAWFTQTTYGYAFWQASAQYRTMRYIPAPQPFFQPLGGFFPRRPW